LTAREERDRKKKCLFLPKRVNCVQKDHLEIILELEDTRGKFDLVLEGHADLDGKIDLVEQRLTTRIDSLEQNLTEKIDAVAEDLRAHRRDTEAHPAFRCVP
jgi:hypothetical protein